MAKPGRPTKFDKEKADAIVRAIRAGNYLHTAAAFAGVHRDTLHDWLRRGAASKSGPMREFSDAVRQAEAHAEVRSATQLAKHGEKYWLASLSYLERRFPERWSQRVKLHVEEELKHALEKLEQSLSANEYEKCLEILSGTIVGGSSSSTEGDE